VLQRIEDSIEDPQGLEMLGHVLFDMVAEKRGILFNDDVYRLTKAPDASTVYSNDEESSRLLPPNHRFASNDVIMLTLQPNGSGDVFNTDALPTSSTAVTLEARTLNTGPTYVDIAVARGLVEATFGDGHFRLRVDRFFSSVPYDRMVAALTSFTAVPENREETAPGSVVKSGPGIDELLKETIIDTFLKSSGEVQANNNEQELAKRLSKPPLPTSVDLAREVLSYIRGNPSGVFRRFNTPQLKAIENALSSRLSMIHGPPGTGKTAVAGAIGFGYVHQCKSVSGGAKVLACAFSNVGADNLAEELHFGLGLKVVRIGRASAVTESLWNCTLDYAIENNADAQSAIKKAYQATAALTEARRRNPKAKAVLQGLQTAATDAVKKSIQASNVASTIAMRNADVIVSTATGAADPRLLAACGMAEQDDSRFSKLGLAPDGLPPLSLPFVIIDEACQSVEPATLVPLVSSGSCRSVVMLGDPCQLPPTVRSNNAQGLSTSLMERLARELPGPRAATPKESVEDDDEFLNSRAIRRAKSVVSNRLEVTGREYKRSYPGSLLLNMQYRMHPSIAAFPSAMFYDGLLVSPAPLRLERPIPRLLGNLTTCTETSSSVRLVHVGGGSNERQGSSIPVGPSDSQGSTSFWNEEEAEQVVSLVKELVFSNDPLVRSIGVISPYSAQVQLIKSKLASDVSLRDGLRNAQVSIEVKSVDGYQGRERDVIIFSAVRSNKRNSIGFLQDTRRMNVALTRARSGLLVIGDFDTLSAGNFYWDALRTWAIDSGCMIGD